MADQGGGAMSKRTVSGQQPLHRRVRIAFGKPRMVEVWSYPKKRTRSVHVQIETRQGEKIQIVVELPR